MAALGVVRSLKSRGGSGRAPPAPEPKPEPKPAPQKVPPGHPDEPLDLVSQLVGEGSAYPQRLVAVHNLNRCFLNAKTFEASVAVAAPLRDEAVVRKVLDLLTCGEPHSYLCLHMLHFAAFDAEVAGILVRVGAVPLLLGVLRAPSEYELAHAALSLLVSLAGSKAGSAALGSSRGAAGVAAGYAQRPEAECRSLARHIVSALLATREGRAQAAVSKALAGVLEAGPPAGVGADEGEMMAWGRLHREHLHFQAAKQAGGGAAGGGGRGVT